MLFQVISFLPKIGSTVIFMPVDRKSLDWVLSPMLGIINLTILKKAKIRESKV